jgi:hypothetical protein
MIRERLGPVYSIIFASSRPFVWWKQGVRQEVWFVFSATIRKRGRRLYRALCSLSLARYTRKLWTTNNKDSNIMIDHRDVGQGIHTTDVVKDATKILATMSKTRSRCCPVDRLVSPQLLEFLCRTVCNSGTADTEGTQPRRTTPMYFADRRLKRLLICPQLCLFVAEKKKQHFAFVFLPLANQGSIFVSSIVGIANEEKRSRLERKAKFRSNDMNLPPLLLL